MSQGHFTQWLSIPVLMTIGITTGCRYKPFPVPACYSWWSHQDNSAEQVEYNHIQMMRIAAGYCCFSFSSFDPDALKKFRVLRVNIYLCKR